MAIRYRVRVKYREGPLGVTHEYDTDDVGGADKLWRALQGSKGVIGVRVLEVLTAPRITDITNIGEPDVKQEGA